MKIKIIVLLSFFYLSTNAQQRNISVDVNKVKGELSQSYFHCVGAGRANEGLRADWQAQLNEVQQKNDLKYIRFHEILADVYMKLYSETAKAINSVSKDYKVGGLSTSGTAWVSDFIKRCVENNYPVDFVTTHAYGVKSDGLDEVGTKKLILLPDLDILPKGVARTKNNITKSQRPDLPLHFTEWNTSYSPLDLVHDTYFNAPYILNGLKKTEKDATSMSYWTFKDIFEEAGSAHTPFHGGLGLINL